jgi:hypothetical protein
LASFFETSVRGNSIIFAGPIMVDRPFGPIMNRKGTLPTDIVKSPGSQSAIRGAMGTTFSGLDMLAC